MISFTSYETSYSQLKQRSQFITNCKFEYYFYNGDNIHTIKGVEGERLIIHSDQIDMPVAMVKNNSDYSYHSDQLGSVLALTDNSNNITIQYNYDAFGNMKVYDSNGVETTIDNSGNIYGYTGREIDKESPFYYYRARYYSPAQGRFLAPDPIGFAGEDFNLYRYVENNPMIFLDPFGLKVKNETNEIIYVITEDSGKVISVKPGHTYEGTQDGFTGNILPGGTVFKTVDGVDVVVSESSITTSGGSFMGFVGQLVSEGLKGQEFISDGKNSNWLILYDKNSNILKGRTCGGQ